MAIQQITPEEAKRRLDAADGSVYLDVRSEGEFSGGHVPGAINIPLMHMEPATRQMVPNPDFLSVVRAVLEPQQKLIVGCAAGARSQKACELMSQAGYADLSNMRGGYSGARDPSGNLVHPGWIQHGLPAATDAGEGVSYASLKARAK